MTMIVLVLSACVVVGAACGVYEAKVRAVGMRALESVQTGTPQERCAARVSATLSSASREFQARVWTLIAFIGCIAAGIGLLVPSHASDNEVLAAFVMTAIACNVAFATAYWLGGKFFKR